MTSVVSLAFQSGNGVEPIALSIKSLRGLIAMLVVHLNTTEHHVGLYIPRIYKGFEGRGEKLCMRSFHRFLKKILCIFLSNDPSTKCLEN